VNVDAVELRGFEEGLFSWLADVFRFSGVDLKSVPLSVGRHFFVNFMPEPQAIVQTAAADAMAYDPRKEPTVAAYTGSSQGIRTGPSRWIKHETTLAFHLRVAGSFERAKALLEELIQAMLRQVKGKRVGTFQVKAATLQQRPTPYQRQGDDRSFAQATVRFLYVALN